MKIQIAQIILCLGVLFALGCWIYVGRVQPNFKLRDEGKMVTGILTNFSTIKAVVIGYSFQVNGTVYKGFYPNSITRAGIGDSIRIMYLPSNPNENAPAIDVLGKKEYLNKIKAL